jgi:spermidine/putrescine transport system substrate-binding protein
MGITGADPTSPRQGRGASRRSLLQWAALAGLGGTAAGLAGCARSTAAASSAAATAGSGAGSGGASAAPTLQIASPDHPVTWPIAAGNQPIAAGLTPERGATLELYNYADYLDPGAVKSFEAKYKQYGVKVRVSTFNDTSEALTKLRSGSVPFDVYFPSYDDLGKLTTAGLIRPLNHTYLANIANVWPQFQNPFYDGEWRYSVPYTVYTTGIAWRADRVTEDIGARPNPYEVFWDPRYAGRISVLDDYREAQSMVLLREGDSDVNTGDDAALAKVRTDLLAMTAATRPKITITQYTELPEGKLDISHAWSGDAVNMVSYLPKGTSPGILRYWFPSSGKGLVNNDLMVVLLGGKNPVLAHLFLDHMLGKDVALANFSFIGYQPPQVSINPKQLVADQYLPANLASAAVLPDWFGSGYRTLELPPDVESKWQANWTEFKAGA